MREPNTTIPWSRGRIVARHRYAEYMASPEWWARREQWVEQWRATFGADPVCAVCDAPWELRRGDLHHRSYDRLGDERFEDLIPMCRDDHTRLHRILDTDPAWKYAGRSAATAGIIATLRRARAAKSGGTR